MAVTLRDGSTAEDIKLGRLPSTNTRRLTLFAAEVPDVELHNKAHLAGPLLDQYADPPGYDGSGCVGFSGVNVLRTSPVRTKTDLNREPIGREFAIEAYNRCKIVDEFEGEGPGTSLDAFGKVMEEWGLITEYRWVRTEPDLARALMKDPVQMGTWWTTGMDAADSDPHAIARFTGRKRGGHAWMVNAYLKHYKIGQSIDNWYRGVNTWGPWGFHKRGQFFVPEGAMAELLADDGEAMIMVERAA